VEEDLVGVEVSFVADDGAAEVAEPRVGGFDRMMVAMPYRFSATHIPKNGSDKSGTIRPIIRPSVPSRPVRLDLAR
jgi:hypothetical protein